MRFLVALAVATYVADKLSQLTDLDRLSLSICFCAGFFSVRAVFTRTRNWAPRFRRFITRGHSLLALATGVALALCSGYLVQYWSLLFAVGCLCTATVRLLP